MFDFVRAGQAYRATTRAQSRDDLASGRVLFAFDWSDQMADIAAAIKARAGFDWDVGLLPSTNGQPATAYQAPLWVIPQVPPNRNPGREKAAWLFVRWLLDGPQTSQWAARTGELPARASAINTLVTGEQQLDEARTGVLRHIATVARAQPAVSGWGCVENVLSDGLRQIFDGKPVTETLQLVQATGQSELNFDCSLQ
jgi:ABC-type glycerol-3-phosphate transport system substrate-binding protein